MNTHKSFEKQNFDEIPLVSVIVPVYNQEQYIEKMIESIILQERCFPIEIIIGDDCSTDDTWNIILQYQKEYPDLLKAYRQKENLGLIKNFFDLAKKCRGKYVMELGGDDYWLPGKIATQVKYMEDNDNVGMCYGKAILEIDGKGIVRNKTIGSECRTFEELLHNNHVPALTACCRNILLQKYIKDICPEEKPWKMEDYPMWLWFSKISKIHFIDVRMACYRLVLGSISHSQKETRRMDVINSVFDIRKFFADGNKSLIIDAEKQRQEEIAMIYFTFNDVKKYRYYNSQVGGMKSKLKNILSYIPGTHWVLSKYYLNRGVI